MACEAYRTLILGRLYSENSPDDDAVFDSHARACPDCRAFLAELENVRGLLREHEPAIPKMPRVLLLRDRSPWRPALAAAALAGATLLAGAGGFFAGRRPVEVATVPTVDTAPARRPASTALDATTRALVESEVAERMSAFEAVLKARADGAGRAAVPRTARPVTAQDLDAAFAKFERKLNGARASDLDYVIEQLTASEARTGRRLGLTNEALRHVALTSNPYVSER